MIDFEGIRKVVYEDIEKTNIIEKVFKKTRLDSGRVIEKELWKVNVEVPVANFVKEFILLIDIVSDFPVSLPKIYLSEKDYESNKYLPHIDSRHFICLFDEVSIKVDTNQPSNVLKACIDRAVKIISDGLSKKNESEFEDEIVAYWEDSYHSKDKVIRGIIGEKTEKIQVGKVNYQYINPAYNLANIFLLPKTEQNEKLTNFFGSLNYKISEETGFYLGELEKLQPPFYYTNISVFEFIKTHFLNLYSDVEKFINKSKSIVVLIFSLRLKQRLLFFGFVFEKIQLVQNGWRQNSLTPIQILTKHQAFQSVIRIKFEEFSSKRLTTRTSGILVEEQPYKFTIAGVGSIGSNLIQQLSLLNVSTFNLVDPEILALENINRHLLSYKDVGNYKVIAVEKYLLEHNPFINIRTFRSSIVEVLKKQIGYINESDFVFCVIGKDSVENYLLQSLSEGFITKPLIILWVEPYLLGGHLLYINPKTNFTLSQLEINSYYKYNIISQKAYLDKKNDIILREAGCQASYVPYSKQSINEFFSALVPQLYGILENKSTDNFALVYSGNLSIAEKLGIELSDYTNHVKNTLNKYIL